MEIYENLSLIDLNGEIWKTIKNFPDYQISSYGRIKSFKKWRGTDVRILKQREDKDEYLFVKLDKINKYIHILLYETFNNYKLKNNECIHHKDENKKK